MKTIILILILIIPNIMFGQKSDREHLKYPGEKRPSMTPVKFAPDLVTLINQNEFGSIFSSDGTEFYYAVGIAGKAEVRYMRLSNNQWPTPERLIFDEVFSYNDPILSPDESKLYFISDKTLDNSKEKKDYAFGMLKEMEVVGQSLSMQALR